MKYLFLIISSFLIISNAYGQDSTKSFAFKNNQPRDRLTIFYQPDLSYRIWQQFNLIREANAGDALAQHELGIRYLFGEGVEADTVKAAKWIKSAAEHGVTAAKYNYAILLINGWGTDWDPFKAFVLLKEAAEEEMPQAQYALGLLYTDNLIVKRNWGKAYNWINKAAEKGNDNAKETLKEIKKKVPESRIDTTASNINTPDSNFTGNDVSLKSSLGLVFIDFEDVLDSVPEISNKRLLEDLTHCGFATLSDSIKSAIKDTNFTSIAGFIPMINQTADYGSPEALTFLGRLYELGICYNKDLLKAIEYYIRAARLDGPTAPILLYQMKKTGKLFPLLKKESDNNDPIALFDWYGLEILGLDNQIAPGDALNLLKRSADMDFVPALIEYGLQLYSNNNHRDLANAFSVWSRAESFGSFEASIRLNAVTVLDQLPEGSYANNIKELFETAGLGSILSQAVIGYAYEQGIQLPKDKALAVKYYREAAQRGSRFAYERLKFLYDAIRPPSPEFNTN